MNEETLFLQSISVKGRQLMTISRRIRPLADVDRFYWKRRDGGRGLVCVGKIFEIKEIVYVTKLKIIMLGIITPG